MRNWIKMLENHEQGNPALYRAGIEEGRVPEEDSNRLDQLLSSSGIYSTMSSRVQSNSWHRRSRVWVDTESPAFMRRMVELLIPPLT